MPLIVTTPEHRKCASGQVGGLTGLDIKALSIYKCTDLPKARGSCPRRHSRPQSWVSTLGQRPLVAGRGRTRKHLEGNPHHDDAYAKLTAQAREMSAA